VKTENLKTSESKASLVATFSRSASRNTNNLIKENDIVSDSDKLKSKRESE